MVKFLAGSPDFTCLGTFETDEAALKIIPRLEPDVVLVGIKLPGMTGSQCVRKLKCEIPQLKAIMLTVHENSESIFEALRAGARGYFLKGTPPQQLLQTIRDVFNETSSSSVQVARDYMFRKWIESK